MMVVAAMRKGGRCSSCSSDSSFINLFRSIMVNLKIKNIHLWFFYSEGNTGTGRSIVYFFFFFSSSIFMAATNEPAVWATLAVISTKKLGSTSLCNNPITFGK